MRVLRPLTGIWLALLPCNVPIAAEEPFPEVYNSQEETQELTPAVEAARRMRVPDGFRVTSFAAEPDVQQPIALTTDERGRLWVAENYTYAERRLNYDEKLRDRILIFEDTDQDGRFDRRTVFWDEGRKLTSIAVGFGGVWALCAPELLFIPDRNGDDVPDGEPRVVLDGWNDGAVRHNIVNGLKWGPDGWLYGRHGIQATSLVGKPGAPQSGRAPLNCSIWRYHPTREVFEVVVHGTTNPWGFDYDDHGQMFFINTVIGHLWHVVPGAHYKRMYGADLNPHVYELIGQCADHYHWDTGERWSEVQKGVSDATSAAGGGHAHSGLMIYLGGNWPDRYRNTLFTVNLHGRRVNNDVIARQGAGYVGRHGKDFLFADDPWFRGLEMVYGPGGGVYLADWADIGECHENDGVHRTSGRIYKITRGSTEWSEPLNLAQCSSAELAELQLRENDWYVRQARRLLQERAAVDEDLADAQKRLFRMYEEHDDVTRRLRALWCLHVTGAIDETWLLKQLDDPSDHVRTWAVRLLVDDGQVTPHVVARLAELAGEESSGLVRLFLASALQRLPRASRWPVARALTGYAEDADDPQLPLMIWYGIEPAVPKAPTRAVALAEQARIPLLRRFIARRLTEDIENERRGVDALVALLTEHKDTNFRLDILQGMSEALRGRRSAPAPNQWSQIAHGLATDKQDALQKLVRELSVVFGDGRALKELRQLAADGAADPRIRRDAIRVLAENRPDGLAPLLQKLVRDRAVAAEAVRGLAVESHPGTPDVILKNFSRLRPEARSAAVTTLASRPENARALLKAVEEGRINRRAISAYHVRQILSFGNESLDRQLRKTWGQIRRTSEQKQRRIAELKATLTPDRLEKADLSNGRLVFQKTCANCHALYGNGGSIGPDLTGSNRHNLDYLLENIVDPSATMIEDFKVSAIALKDGRVVTGVVTEKDERTVAVQTQEKRVLLDRRDVERIAPQDVSLMPEGLLKPLTDKQIRDLIGYLSGRSQVPLPGGVR